MQSSTTGTAPLEANPVTHKFSTVALVPLSDDVPLSAFAYEIYHSLCAIGPTLRLTSDDVHRALGPAILESHYEYRLTSWLAQQEDRNILTLYQSDYALNEWTQRCLRQADVIILVGLGVSKIIGLLEPNKLYQMVFINQNRRTERQQLENLKKKLINGHHVHRKN